MLIRLSSQSGSAVTLDNLKQRLRVDHTDHDVMLQSLLWSESRRYEDFCGRVMLPVSLEYRVSGWQDPISLPAAPVREVTAVKYLDEDHSEQTLDSGDWYFERSADGGDVLFTSAFSSPTLSDRKNPVRVQFSAGFDNPKESGFGDDPELVAPERDLTNIIMLVQRIYDRDEQMDFDEMRKTMGSRRVFR